MIKWNSQSVSNHHLLSHQTRTESCPASSGRAPHPWQSGSSAWRARCRSQRHGWRSAGRPEWGFGLNCIGAGGLEDKKTNLEDSPGLLVDEARDPLDSSTTSQPPDSWLGDALDVVTEDHSVAVSLGSSLPSSCSWHGSLAEIFSEIKYMYEQG